MTFRFKQQRNRSNNLGFTIIELLFVFSLIGILALIALPSYQRYMNEAKAADLLVNIHDITMAYQDVIATAPSALQDHDALSSPNFGQSPSYLPGLAGDFVEKYDISFSAQLVNHSRYFQHTGHEPFPVLFLRANSNKGRDILNALDHVTKLSHTFVTPSMMMMALAIPYETHQSPAAVATSPQQPQQPQPQQQQQKPQPTTKPVVPVAHNSPCNPGFYPWPPEPGQQYGSCKLTPPPLKTDSVSSGSNQNSGGTQQSTPPQQQTLPPQQTSPPQGQQVTTQQVQPSAGSTAGSQLNWPPGWAKHPWQHQNQHHGNH